MKKIEMNFENISNYENKDFDNFITLQIYIQGFIFFETEEEKNYKMTIPIYELQSYRDDNMDVLKPIIEEKVKKYIILKIKEKCGNTVEFSRKFKIPIKHILHCYFINNRIDNIEIIWSGGAIKEFSYVPIRHYLEYKDDSILLKTRGLKFRRKV
jgi:hypothetical protein